MATSDVDRPRKLPTASKQTSFTTTQCTSPTGQEPARERDTGQSPGKPKAMKSWLAVLLERKAAGTRLDLKATAAATGSWETAPCLNANKLGYFLFRLSEDRTSPCGPSQILGNRFWIRFITRVLKKLFWVNNWWTKTEEGNICKFHKFLTGRGVAWHTVRHYKWLVNYCLRRSSYTDNGHWKSAFMLDKKIYLYSPIWQTVFGWLTKDQWSSPIPTTS